MRSLLAEVNFYNTQSMKGTLLLFSLLIYGLCHLTCPLKADSEVLEPRQVSVDFRVLAWKTNLPDLRYDTSGTVEELSAFSVSQPSHYTGPESLNFYSNKRQSNSPKMREKAKTLATVTFPQGASCFTLLAIPNGRDNYRIYAIPENGELLPPRFVLLHNFTNYRIRIDYNLGDRVQIEPKENAYIQLNQGATVVHLSYFDQVKWRKLFNNVVELNDEFRANVIFTDSDERPVTLVAIPHWPNTSEVEPTKATVE